MMQEYVCGFVFSHDERIVYLIEKKRPKWQKGLLNGIGGHVESGESPVLAMRREFEEEAGVIIGINNWIHTASISNYENPADEDGWRVWFFKSVLPKGGLRPVSMTDEKVMAIKIKDISLCTFDQSVEQKTGIADMVANLNWLIPLALYGKDNWPLVANEISHD